MLTFNRIVSLFLSRNIVRVHASVDLYHTRIIHIHKIYDT